MEVKENEVDIDHKLLGVLLLKDRGGFIQFHHGVIVIVDYS